MSRLPEITDLFARLASNLQTLNPTATNEDQEALDLSISNLNQSLNLNDHSRVRVLDTALSLMCFKAPQVFDSVIEYLVKTIVTVLSSSVSCKALRFQKAEFLGVGSEISRSDCAELIRICADVVRKLEGHGTFSHSLLYAVVRVAVSASCFCFGLEMTPIIDVKSIEGGSPTVTKLLRHFPREISLKDQEIPLRLLLWYLDPLILKNDVSHILQDAIGRPFLCFNVAFYERKDWRSVITCLALSPAMFIETRALLHNWFLMTGLACVLEIQIELVSLILDIVSRPMWWGIPMEVGLKLPSSQAYFPHKHHLLRTLAGPLSCTNFLNLVHSTCKQASHSRRHSDLTFKPAATKIGMIDYKSQWAMAMNFPDWFFFALMLLFSEESFQDNFHSKGTVGAAETEGSHDVELPCSAAAARYIAWALNPIRESHRELLMESLAKISDSFALKKCRDNYYKETSGYRKKLKKSKFHDIRDDYALSKEYDHKTIQLWLEEFQDIFTSYWNKIVSSSAASEAKDYRGISLHQNVLVRRIPLGILIGCSHGISEDGGQLLLHYAATGTLLKLTETQTAGLKNGKWNSEGQKGPVTWYEKCYRKEAVAGTCLVFHITDVVESMSASLFETEESGVDFISQVKLRAGKYLLNCVKELLHVKIDKDDGFLMLRDLCNRLVRWKHQGQDVFQGSKDLDDAIDALSHKLSSF